MIISDLSYLEVTVEASTVIGGRGKDKSKKKGNKKTTTVVASPVQINNAKIEQVAKPQVVLVGSSDVGDIKIDIEQAVDLNQENNNEVTVKP